jgi:hypothetical protein
MPCVDEIPSADTYIEGRRRFKKVALAIAAALICLGGLGWYLLWQGGARLGAAKFETNAIQASNQMLSTATTSSSGEARLDCRRIVVVDETGTLLGQKIAAVVVEELRKTKGVEQVDGGEDAIRRGERLPGLFVTLGLDTVQESDGLAQRSLKGRFLANLRTGAAAGFGGYTDGHSGPRFDADWKGTLDHESTSRGDGLGADCYRLTSREIGKQLGEAMRKQIEEWVRKQGTARELPGEFVGPFRETRELDFLRELGAAEVVAGTAMLMHQESAWRWTDARPPATVIGGVVEKLQAAGWQIRSQSSPKATLGPAFAWLGKGDQLVHVFEDRGPAGPLPASPPNPGTPPDAARTFGLHYFDRFTADERCKAVASLLAQDRVKEAGRFENLMSPSQRQGFLQKLEAANSPEPGAWLRLAEYYESLDRSKAATLLRRAVILLAIDENASEWQGRIDALAKKLNDKGLVERPIEDRELASLEIPSLERPVEKTVGVDEPVSGWLRQKDRIYFARVSIAAQGGRDFLLRYGVGEKGGRSSGSQGGSTSADGLWHAEASTGFNDLTVRMQARQLGPERFQLRLERIR